MPKVEIKEVEGDTLELDGIKIPLRVPTRGQSGPTLMDQIDSLKKQKSEKEAKAKGKPIPIYKPQPPRTKSTGTKEGQPLRYRKVSVRSQGEVYEEDAEDEDEEDTPTDSKWFEVLDFCMYLIPLMSVHLVLDVLVQKQYGGGDVDPALYGQPFPRRGDLDSHSIQLRRQELSTIIQAAKRSLTSIPVLAGLHAFCAPYVNAISKLQRGQIEDDRQLPRGIRVFRVLTFAASIAIGCYILYAANEQGYMAVMKRAPPLGTLWVWLIVEMEWNWGALSLVVVCVWSYMRGYLS
ncbi:hypothetical protein CJU90_0097 [Yarrowia sp. C11]|nr:hypothetical protein CKK34_1508 [Yarrowia sp. E02]KAG5372457.1 hypothetical protein CJU90_0097 [Yarrowia sp. C11]